MLFKNIQMWFIIWIGRIGKKFIDCQTMNRSDWNCFTIPFFCTIFRCWRCSSGWRRRRRISCLITGCHRWYIVLEKISNESESIEKYARTIVENLLEWIIVSFFLFVSSMSKRKKQTNREKKHLLERCADCKHLLSSVLSISSVAWHETRRRRRKRKDIIRERHDHCRCSSQLLRLGSQSVWKVWEKRAREKID